MVGTKSLHQSNCYMEVTIILQAYNESLRITVLLEIVHRSVGHVQKPHAIRNRQNPLEFITMRHSSNLRSYSSIIWNIYIFYRHNQDKKYVAKFNIANFDTNYAGSYLRIFPSLTQ
jgi:hypothetical protein